MDSVALFYDLDKFAVAFEPQWHRQLLADGRAHRRRASGLCLGEVMTLLVLFHDSAYRTFKDFYVRHARPNLRGAFPGLPSYTRFVEQVPAALAGRAAVLQTRLVTGDGPAVAGSTAPRVCHNARINSHRVMAGLAARGKTSTGWFYGFKLHLVIDDCGRLINACFTPGDTDGRKPVPGLTEGLFGKHVADKGYISQALFEQLFVRGLHLVTRIRSNMRNRLMPLWDKLLLRKRAIIESVIDQLKNVCQVEHSRHRSPVNYFAEIVAGLIAYTYRPTLPSLNLRPDDLAAAGG